MFYGGNDSSDVGLLLREADVRPARLVHNIGSNNPKSEQRKHRCAQRRWYRTHGKNPPLEPFEDPPTSGLIVSGPRDVRRRLST